MESPKPHPSPPSSILILGSGVFGLSTAYALTQRPEYASTHITLVDRLPFPAPDAASVDSSRIVRADYADPAYTALMKENQPHWRSSFGADGRYSQSGLCIVMDKAAGAGEGNGGKSYMESSLRSVREGLGVTVGNRKKGKKNHGNDVEVLEDEVDVNSVLGSMGGDVGGLGYVNWTSGWADAEAAMRHMRAKLEATNRVHCLTAEMKRLLFSPDGRSISGALLTTGETLSASLTILATGAWTPAFLDLRGIASATGQGMAYLTLTPSEQTALGANPVLFNENNGFFLIPPRNQTLKIARHAYGYANPTTIPHPERPAESGETITVSLPYTKQSPGANPSALPPQARQNARAFLAQTIPALANRPFDHERLCWYLDTPQSEFLIDYHPRYANLFVATGGSGHGFKFLPAIGERIVDLLAGAGGERDGLGRVLRRKWGWPRDVGGDGVGGGWRREREGEGHVWESGWRGGVRGLVLGEEMGREVNGASQGKGEGVKL